jgi:hypothetical protein
VVRGGTIKIKVFTVVVKAVSSETWDQWLLFEDWGYEGDNCEGESDCQDGAEAKGHHCDGVILLSDCRRCCRLIEEDESGGFVGLKDGEPSALSA